MFTIKEKELLTKYGFKYHPGNVHYFGGLECPQEVEEPKTYFVSKLSKDLFELEILQIKRIVDEDGLEEYRDIHTFKNFNLEDLEKYFKEIIAYY